MRIAHIVAATENDIIGKDNGLPWNIPEDMKFFRERTKGRVLITGRKTFESVGHPLPHRVNIVVTRQTDYKDQLKPAPEHSPVVIKPDLSQALEYAKTVAPQYQNEIFIIGGGEIFRQSMDLVDTIYLTRIHAHIEGDATYPQVDETKFRLTEQLDRPGDAGGPAYSFLTYIRR